MEGHRQAQGIQSYVELHQSGESGESKPIRWPFTGIPSVRYVGQPEQWARIVGLNRQR